MNPGAMEEGVRGFFETMRAQPFMLAMVVMNLSLLALLYYVGRTGYEYRQQQLQAIFAEHQATQELLSKCVVPHDIVPQRQP